jgi:hypothetical protein
LPQKRINESDDAKFPTNFTFRLKMGDYEVELNGSYEDVSKTLEELPKIVNSVHTAFEDVKPKTVVTITAKTEEPPKEAARIVKDFYPKIGPVADCREAVITILETDWGKWRPRTMDEMKEVMKANELKYQSRVVSDTLDQLAEKGLIKRWNTNAGSVYILAEAKIPRLGVGNK